MLVDREYGVASTIRGVELWDTAGLLTTAALAAGDVKWSKDGGALTNLGTLPTLVGSTWLVTFTAAELQCSQGVLEIIDQPANTAFVSRAIYVTTRGHPSAFDAESILLAGFAQSGAIGSFRTASAQQPYPGWEVEFVAGPVLDRRVIVAVANPSANNYDCTLDRPVSAALTSSSRYRISGGSLASTVDEMQAGLATAAGLASVSDLVSAANSVLATVQADTTVIPDIKTDTGTVLNGLVTGIKAKTDTLPADIASQSSVTAVNALVTTGNNTANAIKAKTDNLAFTVAGNVDANVQKINDVDVTGGGVGVPWSKA